MQNRNANHIEILTSYRDAEERDMAEDKGFIRRNPKGGFVVDLTKRRLTTTQARIDALNAAIVLLEKDGTEELAEVA